MKITQQECGRKFNKCVLYNTIVGSQLCEHIGSVTVWNSGWTYRRNICVMLDVKNLFYVNYVMQLEVMKCTQKVYGVD